MPSKLDKHIDAIIDRLIEGKTYREIAKEFGVALGTVHKVLTSNEHSARASHALALSASHYANQAEQVLKDAEADKIEIQRARELAHHYRWMAGKRNPKRYGEASLLKLGNPDGEELKVNAIFSSDILNVPTDNGTTEDSEP